MKIIFFILFFYYFGVSVTPLTVEIEELIPTEPEKIPVPVVLMVDDFEDGDFVNFREWWSFGKVLISNDVVTSNLSYLGSRLMNIQASSTNWYAGGLGTYIGAPIHYFKTLKLVIYSPKINAGKIRIELYDDDNNNYRLDMDEKTQQPSKDDLFIYDLNLSWVGWKVVQIQLSEFEDFNNMVGDNTWNPNDLYGSAGLLQIQLIILSSKYQSESIDCLIDTIKFN